MFHRKAWRTDRPQPRKVRLRLEELEPRIVPYNTTGNAWPQPQLVTISFVPDGTTIAYDQYGHAIPSTLFHDFNAKFGSPAVWEKQIELAAQWWAAATNINFSIVGDNGVQIGQVDGTAQQGDPNIGDIRISGFQDTIGGELAAAYQPAPANNYSLAGDIYFNTSQSFNIGTTYDLASVAAHEIGHALGMDHSSDPSAIMAQYYSGTYTTAVSADDASGIRSIYSAGNPRAYDTYNSGSTKNNSFANASTFTVNPTALTAQLNNLDVTTIGQSEYFKFTAPTGSGSTLNLSIQSSGLSLLEPRVWVYNSAQHQIGYKSDLGQYGATMNLAVTGIVAGQTYYIKVNGAESTALGTGKYDLSLSVGPNAVPSVTLPNTYTANGSPLHTGGSEGETPDVYEPNGPGETITGQLPGTTPGLSTHLDLAIAPDVDDATVWVEHHAHQAPAGPNAKAADHFWSTLGAENAALGEDFASWSGTVASLFPRGAGRA